MNCPAAMPERIFRLALLFSLLLPMGGALGAGDAPAAQPTGQGHSETAGKRIEWLSYEQGLKTAREKGLPALVYFYGDHCRYCEVMEKTVFSEPRFISYITARFVPVKVHFQQEPDLVREYKLFGPPAIYFVSPQGKAVFYALGYIAPDKLMIVLHYVGEGHYQAKTYEQYEKEQKK